MPSLMMCTSAVLLTFGMVGGIVMGIQHDFQLGPAHAHLNLVGGVLLFLFGLYYKVVPKAAAMTLAKIQGWLHIAGSIVFPLGIALEATGHHSLGFVVVIGSMVILAAMVLFLSIVARTANA
ncbi:hypothetical protein [Streptomyces sp. AcH 505]|uniref:hypothetical protein n=1 Tax=Streptomyces sp. AcH 505 TaxID=352211 RepID=UPI0018E2F3C8